MNWRLSILLLLCLPVAQATHPTYYFFGQAVQFREPEGPIHRSSPPCREMLAEMRTVRDIEKLIYGYSSKMRDLMKLEQAEDSRRFYAVPSGKTADLHRPFAAAFDETGNYLLYHIPPGALHHDESFNAKRDFAEARPWFIMGDNQLGMVVVRGKLDGSDLPYPILMMQPSLPEHRSSNIPATAELDKVSFSYANKALHEALKGLYGRYGNQGAGRADLLDVYKGEDEEKASRTTHFAIHLNGEVIAHIQAQYSDDPADKLNLEKYKKIPRKKGEPVIELGRMWVKPEREMSPETRALLNQRGGRDFVRTMLFQRFFSWVNADAKCKRVVMQMNQDGKDYNYGRTDDPKRKERAKQGLSPFPLWHFDDDGMLVVNEPERKEWVLSISGDNLLRTEEDQLWSLIEQSRERARKTKVSLGPGMGNPANSLRVLLRENEIPALDRLVAKGRLSSLQQRLDYPKEIPKDRYYGPSENWFNPRTTEVYFDTAP